MKVLKFGGTSVGTIESLRNVKQIVEGIEEPVIVVVSALGGLTDKLIATARMAESKDSGYKAELAAMVKRHADIVDVLVADDDKEQLLQEINGLFEKLSDVYQGIFLLEELSARSLDKVVSFGERLSSRIISKIIADASLFDSTDFIKTTDRFGKHLLDGEQTQALIHKSFDRTDFNVAIVPGFIATDRNGKYTNLGRGGSDYTAAILAATLDADVLEIWTDVDGFLSADPRVVTGTKIIPSLSFTEAMELCNFGAKVIYPPTIYPVFHKNIPIFIKNTFAPKVEGTCIHDFKTSTVEIPFIKGISSLNDTCLLSLGNLDVNQGFTTKVLNTLARNGISVLLVSNAEKPDSLSLSIPASDIERAVSSLEKEFEAEFDTGELPPIEIERNLATIAVVADGMRLIPNISGKVNAILKGNGIDLRAMSQAIPETSIAFVVPMEQRVDALQKLHDELFK